MVWVSSRSGIPRASPEPAAEPKLIIDGTERRRQRPKDPEKQAPHYSGKKKAHTDKNVIITCLEGKDVDFLSRTYVGRTHDKKIADRRASPIRLRRPYTRIRGSKDTSRRWTRTPGEKKSRAEGTHSRGEANRPEARKHRVQVEHALAGVKRSRIVKDVFRNTKTGSQIRPWRRLVGCTTSVSKTERGD